MNKRNSRPPPHSANRLARLAAVQALYQTSYEQQPVAQIVRDSIDGNFSFLREDDEADGAALETPDRGLFKEIVEGVAAHTEELDAAIAGALDARLAAKKLERLLQTILRAGAFELRHHAEVPAAVIINDYIDVAKAFYEGKEAGLVNGLLDKLAGKLRKS